MNETRLKRLRFRAWRRGFREADLILGPFADRCAHSLSARQLTTFEALLDLPDHDVYAWIVGNAAPSGADVNELVALIRAFHTGGGART
jgi:antitoxin CptB